MARGIIIVRFPLRNPFETNRAKKYVFDAGVESLKICRGPFLPDAVPGSGSAANHRQRRSGGDFTQAQPGRGKAIGRTYNENH